MKLVVCMFFLVTSFSVSVSGLRIVEVTGPHTVEVGEGAQLGTGWII